MIITAILAIRNEAAHLANCLRHLVSNDIVFSIIDNGSVDECPEIYRRREFSAHLVGVNKLPFTGAFSLTEQLRCKMTIMKSLNSDWVIHIDADEVMYSCRRGETLRDAIVRTDTEGWNVIDFDEFVFLPIEHDYVPDSLHPQPILHYYYFRPSFPRLMRAWKKSEGFSMIEHGGHLLSGADIRLAPERCVLRHYMMRNQQDAFTKYAIRCFAAEEVARGWHNNRINQPVETFEFPPATELRKLGSADDCKFDLSDPWAVHYWQRKNSG